MTSGGFRVSDSVIEAAAAAMWDAVIAPILARGRQPSTTPADYVEYATAALTTALPSLVAEIREQIASEIKPILLNLSDMLDPVEGPVILAWSTPVLADRIAAEVARGDAG